VPRSWNLEQIEEWAAMFGNEVLLGPRKAKIVRVITEFVPYPEAARVNGGHHTPTRSLKRRSS
jgi:hypothetical protein